MNTLRTVSCTLLAAVAWLALSQSVEAQVVPFVTTTDDGEYTPATAEYSGTGKATHMGKVAYSGLAIPTPTEDPLVFTWVAPFHEITAANGDQIFLAGAGTVELMPIDPTDPATEFTAEWTADFEVIGGTGRFANVSGVPGEPLAVTAINNPFALDDEIWTFAATIEGVIDLGKRKKK